ncbi:unnamed protein product [Linum tenue]|uniref:HIG1 domain-containing protein n=1 Tax=Linum tenue TaxID=586396 RepID=A0AAV0NML7_9ROSI|nr:unnamed protein product [Linum tenue]
MGEGGNGTFESIRDWVSEHKMRSVATLWASGIAGSIAYNWSQPNMKTSVKIIHARISPVFGKPLNSNDDLPPSWKGCTRRHLHWLLSLDVLQLNTMNVHKPKQQKRNEHLRLQIARERAGSNDRFMAHFQVFYCCSPNGLERGRRCPDAYRVQISFAQISFACLVEWYYRLAMAFRLSKKLALEPTTFKLASRIPPMHSTKHMDIYTFQQ